MSRQDLADFALRQLGGGIINIEATPDQIDDAISLTLKYYQEYHFDGIMQDYVKFQVTYTKVTFASTVGFAVGDTITNVGGGSAVIKVIAGSVVSLSKNIGTAWANNQTVTNGTASTTISAVNVSPLDSGYFTVDDTVLGVTRILNIGNVMAGTELLFNVQYQVMLNEMKQLTSGGGINYLYGTMNYLQNLDFVLRKEKSFRFNRRMNKIFLDINWDVDVKVGDWLVIEIYRGIDPEVYEEIYSDLWVQKYTTAQIKKVWGASTKKYEGVQLPGGVTYTGQRIYEEAIAEIKELEQELRDTQPPLLFMVG
jgi:hypothetical protein